MSAWSGTQVRICWLRHGSFVAVRAGHVKNDLGGLVFIGLGVELGVDGGKSAQELVGDVGKDGGFARGNAIFREENQEASEEVVDRNSGAEFL